MQLSKHFQLWEFTTSQTAERWGIGNQPNKQQIANLKRLCEEILQPAREKLGALKISSGYRSPVLNKRVGGSTTSAHKEGWAADIIPIQCSKRELARWIAHNCQYDQLILEFGTKQEPSWIHVAVGPGQRKEDLQILKGTGYQPCKL